ncbi:MAG TPA: membrane protein insertase YidC [Streptosporangiaceae bacterium]|nr:membrane protein insertase YidC [Streptosporangiaceae bacterium]
MGNPLNPVYEAVAWVLKQIYGLLSPIFGIASGWTWALSIVILVALMRLIMVPLFIKQMHTTRAMSALAPQISALRKKYKNDKQTLNQETMKLYQEAGVNPLMGCLPVVAQLPLFFALFSVLKAIAEWKPGEPPKYGLTYQMVFSAQHAKILGATVADKFLFSKTTVPLEARAVILVAVLVSMTTTYLTVRQSMKRGMMPAASPDNPMGQSQKYMAYIMPLFALSGLYWPFGLVLYWVTTNLWTLGQQWFLFRRYPQPLAAGAAAADATLPPAAAAGRAKAPSGSSSSPRALRPGQGPAKKNGSAADGGGQQNGGRSAPRPAAGPAAATANGQPAAGGGGMLRRLGKSRSEPEPKQPEVKLVQHRQQPQRQSRSKRSGKR